MEEYLVNLKTLLGVLGHKTLEPLVNATPKELVAEKDTNTDAELALFLNIKGLKAQAILNDEGLVVLKGSFATTVIRESLSNGYKKLREKLIDSGVMINNGTNLIFTKNYLFTSPSQAAAILAGYAINGRNHWLTIEGTTLKQLELQNAE